MIHSGTFWVLFIIRDSTVGSKTEIYPEIKIFFDEKLVDWIENIL